MGEWGALRAWLILTAVGIHSPLLIRVKETVVATLEGVRTAPVKEVKLALNSQSNSRTQTDLPAGTPMQNLLVLLRAVLGEFPYLPLVS